MPLQTESRPWAPPASLSSAFSSRTHAILTRRLPMNDLFGALDSHGFVLEELAPGAILLRGKALPSQDSLLAEIEIITNKAPFRNMVTPGGYVMSVAMTNCGAAGWVTDRSGHRYDRMDPESGRPWPALPDCFPHGSIFATGQPREVGYAAYRRDHLPRCEIGRQHSQAPDRSLLVPRTASKDLTPQVLVAETCRGRLLGPGFLICQQKTEFATGERASRMRVRVAATIANLSIRGKSLMTTLAENKAIAGRWFDVFWGKSSDSDVIEELASPDLVFQSAAA